MRLNRYITELSMAKKPKIKILNKPTLYHADIELDMEDVYQQSKLLFYFDATLDTVPSYMRGHFPVLMKSYNDYFTAIEEMHGNPNDLPAPAIWTITFEDSAAHMEIEEKPRGVALNLFAAIEKVMRDFVKAKKPLVFSFSSEEFEESRVKLYNLLAKRISKKGGYDVEVQKGLAQFYLFTKKGLKDNWWMEQHYIGI